jgi:hypothetical protein
MGAPYFIFLATFVATFFAAGVFLTGRLGAVVTAVLL